MSCSSCSLHTDSAVGTPLTIPCTEPSPWYSNIFAQSSFSTSLTRYRHDYTTGTCPFDLSNRCRFVLWSQMRVPKCHLQICMPQQLSDRVQVHPCHNQTAGKMVAQVMHRNLLIPASFSTGIQPFFTSLKGPPNFPMNTKSDASFSAA